MGLFDRDYDREFNRRPVSNDLNYDTWRYRAGGRYGGDSGSRGYNERNYQNETTRPFSGGYGRDTGYRGYDRGMRGGYDDEMRTVGIGYDEEYKPRYQTDMGDPFGDRQSRTPVRVIRGEARGYDRGFRGYDRNFSNRGYGRDYSSNPMSYDPGYSNTRRTGNDRGWFGSNRGYDRNWF
jgi:hypothetical protein